MLGYFPKSVKTQRENDYSLQSRLFGHRFKANQTIYEYLLEFLQVMISPKKIMEYKQTEEFFPIDSDIERFGFTFDANTTMALKRFVFWENSKADCKALVDAEAYKNYLNQIRDNFLVTSQKEKDYFISIIQNLLLGFGAVNQNRAWYFHNMLPICPEVISAEGAGTKGKRDSTKVGFSYDNSFEYTQRTYMCRGGEIYYLHVLSSINQYPEYAPIITVGFRRLINSYPQFSTLCKLLQKNWENFIGEKARTVNKAPGTIPKEYEVYAKYTLSELANFLTSKMHSFEKTDILAYGTVIQLMRLMYQTATKQKGVWIMDLSEPDLPNTEMKKLAIHSYYVGEQKMASFLYEGYDYYREELPSDEKAVIRSAGEDSYILFRKLGKNIGIIIPQGSGAGTRFTMSEPIIKFLVLSLIKPTCKITLDRFVELLYSHYSIVIGREQYEQAVNEGRSSRLGTYLWLDDNYKTFSQKLKDCGFLRDLSDATSIVENPYDKEVDD